MIRDAIADILARRQQLEQPQRPVIPKPFIPQVPPVRSLPPTMIGTPPKVQQAAIQDFLGQAQRAADPFDPYEADGATVVGKALKKLFFTPEVTGGGAAP